MNPQEIIENINLLTSKATEIITRETQSLTKQLIEELKKLSDLATNYKRQIEEAKIEWKRIKDEVFILEGNREKLKERQTQIDAKIKELAEQEESLISLHKALDNRAKVIKAQEQELKEKERRSQSIV